jgi:hypothetical protein
MGGTLHGRDACGGGGGGRLAGSSVAFLLSIGRFANRLPLPSPAKSLQDLVTSCCHPGSCARNIFPTPPARQFSGRLANLYVSNEGNNTVQKYGPGGGTGTVFANTGLSQPYGLAFAISGNLFVANRGNDTIREFSSNGSDMGVFADVSTGLNQAAWIAIAPVPEPGTVAFVGVFLLGVATARRRQR